MGTTYRRSAFGSSLKVKSRGPHGGYVMLNFSDGTSMLEHRYVAELTLGRPLTPLDYVHHKNGKKDDNDSENLEVMTSSSHSRHHQLPAPRTRVSCAVCSNEFSLLESRFKYNQARGSSLTCSKECAGHVGKGTVPKDHGTIGSYMRCGPPRCIECRKAMADYMRQKRKNARG